VTKHYLPSGPTVRVTPELLCRLLDDVLTVDPAHEEGDVALTVDSDDLQALMTIAGHEYVVGYKAYVEAMKKEGEDDE
jgi:hypothetical protein